MGSELVQSRHSPVEYEWFGDSNVSLLVGRKASKIREMGIDGSASEAVGGREVTRDWESQFYKNTNHSKQHYVTFRDMDYKSLTRTTTHLGLSQSVHCIMMCRANMCLKILRLGILY